MISLFRIKLQIKIAAHFAQRASHLTRPFQDLIPLNGLSSFGDRKLIIRNLNFDKFAILERTSDSDSEFEKGAT